MKSLVSSWLATVCALATLTLLPNVSAISAVTIIISATLVWLVLILLWPIFKLFLLPFNLASFGLIGSVVYFLLFWLCLWLVPGITVLPVRIFGYYAGDVLVLSLLSIMVTFLQRIYSVLLSKLLREKRRK